MEKLRQIVLTLKEESEDYTRVELEVRNCNADEITLAAEVLAKEAAKFMSRPIGGRFN